MLASDYQEAKNVNTVGNDLMPNTAFLQTRLTVVNGPTVTWIEPPAHVCAVKNDRLLVVAASTTPGHARWSSATTAARSASTRSGPGGVFAGRGTRRS